MSDDIDAVTKLTAATGLGPPGPMIGFHGRLNPTLKPDPTLQIALDAALADAETMLKAVAPAHPGLPTSLASFSFAVVDLTNDPRIPGFGAMSPAYAGHNDTRTRGIASLAKLLALYAAHQIRSDARALASVTAPTTIGALANLMRQHHRRMGAADDTFPLIEDMLAIDANGNVDFQMGGAEWPGITRPITDIELRVINSADHADPPPARFTAIQDQLKDSTPLATKATLHGQLAQIAFREQLRLMAGWSNNISASIVIKAIGFRYLWRLANRSGLFRPGGWERLAAPRQGARENPGGLFLGQDYAGNVWTDRARGAPVFGASPSQAGNARSVAQLMTSLASELINDEAHISMREMLRKRQAFGVLADVFGNILRGEDCPIGEGMAIDPSPGWRALQTDWDYGVIPNETSAARDSLTNGELASSKIGLLDLTKDGVRNLTVCNALLVRATRGTGAAPLKITAVLVVLTSATDINPAMLSIVEGAFGKTVALKLDARHP
jgi:hypothetical protein